MNTLPRVAFVVVLVVVPMLIWATAGTLPPDVASHFGPGGGANGWMPRTAYLGVILLLATALPLLVACTSGLTPRLTRVRKLVRHPDYWLAPGRREATETFLANHACALGILLSLFMLALHLLTLQANGTVPPALPEVAFFVVLGVFLASMAAWVAALHFRFRMPR